jgi:hypothetical protein
MFYTTCAIYNEFKQVYYKEFWVLITFDTPPNAKVFKYLSFRCEVSLSRQRQENLIKLTGQH